MSRDWDHIIAGALLAGSLLSIIVTALVVAYKHDPGRRHK